MNISTNSSIKMSLEYGGLEESVPCTVHGLLNQQTGYIYFTHIKLKGFDTEVSSAKLSVDECEAFLTLLESQYGSKALVGGIRC